MRRALAAVGLTLGLIVWTVPAPFAQQQPSSRDEITRQTAENERLADAGQARQAVSAFEAIIDAAHSLGFEAEEARARCSLGIALEHLAKYTEAETALRQCLAMAERMQNGPGAGRALFTLSAVASASGRSAEAASLAERAVAAYDDAHDLGGRAKARLQLLNVRPFPLDEEEVIQHQIIDDARLVHDQVLEASAFHSWGDRLFTAARYEEAFDALIRARDLYQAAGELASEGTVFNSLGRVYRAHGRLDEALKCQLQALALHEKYGTAFMLMQSHNAVAVVQEFLGDLAGAHEHWDRALAIARQSGSPRIQDFLRANIALLQIDEGSFETAARSLEEVIARGVDSNTSVRYSNLALAYLHLNRAADATKAADRALETCGEDQFICLDALENRATAYGALNNVPVARADLRKAVDIIEHMRSTLVPADLLKQDFQTARREVYSASIALAFRQHEVREALETAELASSRAFLDLLAARRDRPETPAREAVPPPGGAPGADSRDLVSDATAAPANADDLVAIARRLHSTLIEYWPGEKGLFIWIVNRDGKIVGREVPISSARLLELIRAASPSGSTSREQVREVRTRGAVQVAIGDPVARRAWRQLYEALVAPIRDQLPAPTGSLLTIVPHGVLMTVSFAALQTRDGRYLLEDYAVNYAPAGAVLQFTAQHRVPDARSGRVLVVADPTAVRRSPLDPQLPPLPGARREAAEIATLIPRRRMTLLEGSDASEPRVRAATEQKAIVHFATHAIVRDDDPNASYLAFSPVAGDAESTGFLTVRDVYDLSLNADLVVLSACRSGGGRVTGDGIAAFARAFVYAGAPSLVVSLWDVADQPAERLLPAFYRAWLGGASKARSLRRAQLQLLADLRAGNVKVQTRAGPILLPEDPIFWAGFVLIGEPD